MITFETAICALFFFLTSLSHTLRGDTFPLSLPLVATEFSRSAEITGWSLPACALPLSRGFGDSQPGSVATLVVICLSLSPLVSFCSQLCVIFLSCPVTCFPLEGLDWALVLSDKPSKRLAGWLTGIQTGADDQEGSWTNLDLCSYFILFWQKSIRLCFGVELIQIKKAALLLKEREKKEKTEMEKNF